MATTYARHPLTKYNLAIHDRLLEDQHATDAITAWVDKVILEEQNHLFCSQMGVALSDMRLSAGASNANSHIEQEMERIGEGVKLSSSTGPTGGGPLKIFEQQRPLTYLESPLERYLTPGSSDPSYFSRPTMAHGGSQYGSMEGRKERRDMVRGHVEVVKENALKAQSTSST
ncbi:uncharacterized protein BDV17DRAFT_138918 [Aspergillus undulatus]|uniref:uncharacterized protein n=1 Tax=Aspergillus undulatus TaxID=1810928 RepID=UPI003CCDA97F